MRELEWVEVARRPFYVASLGYGNTRIVPVDGPPRSEFERQHLEEAVTAATRSAEPPVY